MFHLQAGLRCVSNYKFDGTSLNMTKCLVTLLIWVALQSFLNLIIGICLCSTNINLRFPFRNFLNLIIRLLPLNNIFKIVQTNEQLFLLGLFKVLPWNNTKTILFYKGKPQLLKSLKRKVSLIFLLSYKYLLLWRLVCDIDNLRTHFPFIFGYRFCCMVFYLL